MSNELYHYGTPKQKWYQRLYQNPDGTYTELGKLRRRQAYKKQQREDSKALKKKLKNQTKADILTEKYSKLSDEELKKLVDRKKLERDAYRTEKEIMTELSSIRGMTPERKNAISKIIKDAFNKVIVDQAVDVGKDFVNNYLRVMFNTPRNNNNNNNNNKEKNN